MSRIQAHLIFSIQIMCTTTQHVVNIMTLKKINILEYALGRGGGGDKKEYSLYAFINVDNCEQPLTCLIINASLTSAS